MASHNTTLEYLTTTKIGEKGQLTVPKQFREDLGLGNGAPFAVLRLGDGLILLPEQQRFEQLCGQVSACQPALVLHQTTSAPRCLRLAIACARGFMERGLQPALPDAVLEPIGGSDGPAQNPPLSGFQCPDRRNCFALGTRQSDSFALCSKGLQARFG